MSRSFIFSLFLVCLSAVSARGAQPLALVTRDGLSLNGIYDAPESPVAVALLLSGSGNVGMDGDISSPFVGAGYRGARAALSEQLASALSATSIATYRYAKRGFEDSSQLPNQTFDFLLNDAEDALMMLRARSHGLPVVVVGFSEGALLATHLATRRTVDGLYLLGLPTRSIDDLLAYQFVEWPVSLLRNLVDANHDGVLEPAEQEGLTSLPVVGAPFASADQNHDGLLSLSGEIAPFYQQAYLQLRGLLSTPSLAGWYQAMRALPDFAGVASRVSAPVHLYNGARDPQVNPLWTLADSRYFPNLVSVHLLEGVGHAFAPLDGRYGETKTSGPFSAEILSLVALDIISTIVSPSH